MCAVAGILAKMLCFPVSLLDIEKWFPKLRSQKTIIHEELTAIVSSRGLTWPPNAQGFQHCSSYKQHPSSGKLHTIVWIIYNQQIFTLCPPLLGGLRTGMATELLGF